MFCFWFDWEMVDGGARREEERKERGLSSRICGGRDGKKRKRKMDGGVAGVSGYKLHVNVNVNMLCAKLALNVGLCEHSPHYGAPLPRQTFITSASVPSSLPPSPSLPPHFQLDPVSPPPEKASRLVSFGLARQSVALTLFRCNARLPLLPAKIHRAYSTKAVAA